MLRVLGAAQVLCRAHVATDMVELKSHRCPLRCAWLCCGMAGVQMGSEMIRDVVRRPFPVSRAKLVHRCIYWVMHNGVEMGRGKNYEELNRQRTPFRRQDSKLTLGSLTRGTLTHKCRSKGHFSMLKIWLDFRKTTAGFSYLINYSCSIIWFYRNPC